MRSRVSAKTRSSWSSDQWLLKLSVLVLFFIDYLDLSQSNIISLGMCQNRVKTTPDLTAGRFENSILHLWQDKLQLTSAELQLTFFSRSDSVVRTTWLIQYKFCSHTVHPCSRQLTFGGGVGMGWVCVLSLIHISEPTRPW